MPSGSIGKDLNFLDLLAEYVVVPILDAQTRRQLARLLKEGEEDKVRERWAFTSLRSLHPLLTVYVWQARGVDPHRLIIITTTN